MAQIYTFERESDDDLIIVSTIIGNTIVDLVLDTGASHTFIDFGILINEGFRLSDTKGLVQVETANGIINSNTFVLRNMSALGITKTDFEITSYLFDDPENNFKGVIGLDFLAEKKFCIDLKRNKLTVE